MNKAPRAQQQGNNNNNQNVGHSKASGCNVIVNPSAAPEVEDEGEDDKRWMSRLIRKQQESSL